MTSAPVSEPSPSTPSLPAPGNAVLLIERMSVRYDGLEDRIAMDITSAEGRLARLWLTRYGADVLVRSTSARVDGRTVES